MQGAVRVRYDRHAQLVREIPFEAGVVHVDLLEGGRLLQDGQQALRALVRQFQIAAAELQEERVELQGGNDRYQILRVQMIKVPQVELFRVMGQINRVHVPGDFFSVGKAVIIAHAGVLTGEVPARNAQFAPVARSTEKIG